MLMLLHRQLVPLCLLLDRSLSRSFGEGQFPTRILRVDPYIQDTSLPYVQKRQLVDNVLWVDADSQE
jgi:hypothetical protein